MIRVRKNPDAYFISIDGHCLEEAGNHGLIRNAETASLIAELLQLETPHLVQVFAGYTLTGA